MQRNYPDFLGGTFYLFDALQLTHTSQIPLYFFNAFVSSSVLIYQQQTSTNKS